MKEALIKRARAIFFWGGIGLLIGLAVLVIVFPGPGRAQEEVASHIARYRERVRTGYHEGYEVRPRRQLRAETEIHGILHRPFPLSPTSAEVRIRARLADSHIGIKFYEQHTCIACHPQQARSFHADRAGISCRQCHGPEPIPAINHYYSPMNPIRRHAYVCARCHEGANALFATYLIHEPPPGALTTRKSFPAFFYTNWFMVLLLLGTMAFFIPHSLMMVVQELAIRKGKTGIDILLTLIPHRFKETLRKRFPKKETPEK
jgi:hypothetical protein